MSLELINNIASDISNIHNLHCYALKYKHRVSESEFTCCEIHFKNDEDLVQLVIDIFDNFQRNKLSNYEEVDDYSGFNGQTIISKINLTDPLIKEQFEKLKIAYLNSDTITKILDFNASAYILKGNLNYQNNEYELVLFTKRKPFKTLGKAFGLTKNTFEPIEKKILQLGNYFDMLSFGDNLYLLNFNGESILNLEKSYKRKCIADVDLILSHNIIDDCYSDFFKRVASSKHNPRKFLTFNKERLNQLSIPQKREELGRKFGISTSNNIGRFILENDKDAEKLIKVLCDKAAVDFFDNTPREVSLLKPWN